VGLSLSSSVVREPSPVLVLSTAHRAGLLGALKTIARQVAGDGVTVNSLLPGTIATDRGCRRCGASGSVAAVLAGAVEHDLVLVHAHRDAAAELPDRVLELVVAEGHNGAAAVADEVVMVSFA